MPTIFGSMAEGEAHQAARHGAAEASNGAAPARSCSAATSSAPSAGRRSRTACRCCASATTPTFVVVNGENVAGGFGITPKIADELFAAGVDVITLGNHAYRRREIYPYLDTEPRILRPANYLRSQPGHGHHGRSTTASAWP